MKKIILLFVTAIYSFGFSQKGNNIELTKELEKLYKKSNFPGFAVAIVSDKAIEYQSAFGYSDLKKKKPYTLKSIQNIGSVSKTFIGVAIAKSIELGYFNLETNINDILPFKVINPNLITTNEIKIKHLVTHTSGIIDDEKVYQKSFLLYDKFNNNSPLHTKIKKDNTIPDRKDIVLADFLANYFESKGNWYKKTNFNSEIPGDEYNYSNIGSALAAYLIEIKSKMSFEDFCKKFITKPLKMNASSWSLNDTIFSKHVKAYNHKKQFYPIYSEITYPDGSLNTSCEELSKYLFEMIKGYNGNSTLLNPESYNLLFKKQFLDEKLPKNYDPKEPNSGLFWRIKKNGQIGHTGSDLGITTFLFFDPKTNIGRIFMTNIEFDNPETGEINEKLVTQFIEIWKILEKHIISKSD